MNIQLDYNKVKNACRITLDNPQIKDRLYYAFSIPNENKKFVKGVNKHWIKDRIYFITPAGFFPFGLCESILKWFKTYVNDITIEYSFTDSFKERFRVTNNNDIIFNNHLNLALRDYQQYSVICAMKYHFGTFVLGTGAGKTLTIASIIDNLFSSGKIKKALILVPDNGLVTQFNEELSEVYGLRQKISLFFDKYNEIDEEAEVIIANRPLFLSRFNQYEKFWRENIDCLIVDEAHSIKRGNKVSDCIAKMQSFYRFGFTRNSCRKHRR